MRDNHKFSYGTGVVSKYEKRSPEKHILPGLQEEYKGN